MPKKLLSPDDARASALRAYQLHHRSWLAGAGEWPWNMPLGKPTEREVANDAGLVRGWVEAWRSFAEPGWVRWAEVKWPRLGSQSVPTHLEVPSAAALAQLVGEEARFSRATERYARCVTAWPGLAGASALTRAFDVLAGYSEADFQRLERLVSWLHEHPRSGYALRQLPVPGLDTKWIDEKRKRLVSEWLSALRQESSPDDFYQLCGLRPPPVRLRMRVLCPVLRAALSGLCDVQAPIEELAQLSLTPLRVLIVENLESGLALSDLPGCVAFLGLGNAVSLLSRLSWVMGKPLVYWGDLDTHGFAILDRARASLGELSSVLMDEQTLLSCRELWGEEPLPCNTELTHLTQGERGVFEGLRAQRWGHHVRLEQERIPWEMVLKALRASHEA
jgi:hypothetical protein